MKTYTLRAWATVTARMLPEYGQWAAMINRCTNPNTAKYKNYGGRGISVCHRWRVGVNGASGFECFLADMGPRPGKQYSIDRVNNNGDYCPGNCQWATNTQQARNRRSNRRITYKGESMCMMEAAEKFGISYYVLRNRISRGWSVELAIETPAVSPPAISQRSLSRKAGINNSTLRARIRRGMSFADAISTPVKS